MDIDRYSNAILYVMNVIPRVAQTPQIPITSRGRVYQTHQPQVGSVMTIECNGFGSGLVQSYVVINTFKNKNHVVNAAQLAVITAITDKDVTFDPEKTLLVRSYFQKKYGHQALWHYEPDPRISFSTWDEYKPYDAGFMK